MHHDELLFIVAAPDLRAVAQAGAARAARGAGPARRRRAAPGAQGAGPGQAHPAHAHRPVVGARHPDPVGVRRVPRRARHVVGVPVRPVPGRGVRAGQQERRDAAAVRARRARAGRCSPSCSPARASTTSSCATSPGTATTCPRSVLDRDVTQPHTFTPELVPVFRRIYEHATEFWEAYEACEELVDLEENFQLWRFRHLKTVERTIGLKRGTGGSSGVAFLRAALETDVLPGAVRGAHGDRHVTADATRFRRTRGRARRRRPAGPVARALPAQPGRRRLPGRQLARPAAGDRRRAARPVRPRTSGAAG